MPCPRKQASVEYLCIRFIFGALGVSTLYLCFVFVYRYRIDFLLCTAAVWCLHMVFYRVFHYTTSTNIRFGKLCAFVCEPWQWKIFQGQVHGYTTAAVMRERKQ